MPTSTPEQLDNRATAVRFEPAALIVSLVDGREISVPIAWFPRLAGASPEQRARWELIGQGTGIHWPDVDEDISVPRLLGLPCE
jgi:hypothetical protein